MDKTTFIIMLCIIIDYIFTMLKLHDIEAQINKLEEKINALKEKEG